MISAESILFYKTLLTDQALTFSSKNKKKNLRIYAFHPVLHISSLEYPPPYQSLPSFLHINKS